MVEPMRVGVRALARVPAPRLKSSAELVMLLLYLHMWYLCKSDHTQYMSRIVHTRARSGRPLGSRFFEAGQRNEEFLHLVRAENRVAVRGERDVGVIVDARELRVHGRLSGTETRLNTIVDGLLFEPPLQWPCPGSVRSGSSGVSYQLRRTYSIRSRN